MAKATGEVEGAVVVATARVKTAWEEVSEAAAMAAAAGAAARAAAAQEVVRVMVARVVAVMVLAEAGAARAAAEAWGCANCCCPLSSLSLWPRHPGAR